MRNIFRIAIIFFFFFTFFFFNSRAQAITDYFLPLFYIPQNIINTNLDTKNLLDILGFEDYKIRSGIYLDTINGLTDSRINGLKDRADEFFIKGEKKDIGYLILDIEKRESLKNSVFFPYVKHSQGSFWWKLAGLKEKYEEWKVRKDPGKLIDKKLYFASKRITEYEKWGKEKDIKYWILDIYQKKMEETVKEIEKLTDLDKPKVKALRDLSTIKLRAYWERHKEKIEEIYQDKFEGVPSENDWERVFEVLDGEIKALEPFDLRNLEYSFKIPKKGTYSMFIGNIDGLMNLGMNGNTLEINRDKIETNGGWIKLGEREFKEGNDQLVLNLPESDNLVGTNWRKFEETKVKEGGVEFTQNPFPDVKNLVFQEINNWQSNNLYSLSFDYTVKESHLGVGIMESKIERKEENDVIKKEKVLSRILINGKNDEWQTFNVILRADKNTLGAEIYFYTPANSNNSGKVEFKNLKIERIYQLEIILKSIKEIKEINGLTNYDKVVPKITFVRINPTKYRVKIEGAVDPYTLVFSESFHQGWKLYINGLTDSEINGLKNDELKNYGETVASYFDGEVKEGTHRNIFIEKATFETWGKKAISEDRHLLVNGYANSWYITPEDAGGKRDYEIIIEFWPQRLFYLGLFISGLTLFSCLGYLGYDYIKRRKVARNS